MAFARIKTENGSMFEISIHAESREQRFAQMKLKKNKGDFPPQYELLLYLGALSLQEYHEDHEFVVRPADIPQSGDLIIAAPVKSMFLFQEEYHITPQQVKEKIVLVSRSPVQQI